MFKKSYIRRATEQLNAMSMDEPMDLSFSSSNFQVEQGNLTVNFENPSNCQFYFGVDAKKDSNCNTSTMVMEEPERIDGAWLCTDHQETIPMLETAQAQLLPKVSNWEERIGALENESREIEVSTISAISSRGEAVNEVSGQNFGNETISDVSTDTGEAEPGDQLTPSRTATPPPAPSGGGTGTTLVVPNSDASKAGRVKMSGLQVSLKYPGPLSCLCEIVNRCDNTPLIEVARSVGGTTVVHEIPTHVDFAKSVLVSKTGSNTIKMGIAYNMGRIRFAFAICINGTDSSYFRLKFLGGMEHSSALSETMDKNEFICRGSPDEEQTLECSNFCLKGKLTSGKKAYFKLDLIKMR